MLVKRAAVADVDAVAPLFDGYRQFYGQRSDLAAARAFLEERLRRDESVIFLAVADEGPGSDALGFTQLYPSFSSVSVRRASGHCSESSAPCERCRKRRWKSSPPWAASGPRWPSASSSRC